MRVINLIDAVGSALMLQICALVASLTIVSAVPASVALQRQLAALAAGEKTGVVPFAREFRRSWAQSWIAGVLVPLVVVSGLVAMLFWRSVEGPAGILATGTLLFLGGLGLSVALAALKYSGTNPSSRPKEWVDSGFRYLVRAPLRGLWATVMMLGWVSLALYLPTLLLIGSALMPALIVRWCLVDDSAGRVPESL